MEMKLGEVAKTKRTMVNRLTDPIFHRPRKSDANNDEGLGQFHLRGWTEWIGERGLSPPTDIWCHYTESASRAGCTPSTTSMVTLSDSNKCTHQSQSHHSTSSLLRRRIRSVISDVNPSNTERTIAELVSWIGSDPEPDLFLLEFIADTVLEDVTEQLNRQSSELAQFSYRLAVSLPTYHGILLSRLQSQFLESIQFAANHRTAEQGSWPELVALVGFAGELCSVEVVSPAVLLDVYVHHLSRQLSRSELELEAICALFKAAGPRLCDDPYAGEVLTRETQSLQDIHDQGNISPLLSKKLAVSCPQIPLSYDGRNLVSPPGCSLPPLGRVDKRFRLQPTHVPDSDRGARGYTVHQS